MPHSAPTAPDPNADPGAVRGPLQGCRVLELGSVVAGPFCGRLLADFGAEVVKIEPIEGDGIRSIGKRHKGKSLNAVSLLRNKSLISVDLRKPEGQALVRKLVPAFDIVIENFRPGGLEKWGLGYEDLRELHPALVMVRISGYGQTGPYSARPGFGVIAEAMSGLRHITGDPDRPPARVGVQLTDYITGLYGAFGAMLALHHRHRTGEGQFVDAALYECAFSFMEPFVPAYDQLRAVANRTGPALADSAPNNLYPTRDRNYVHITGNHEAVFRRLAGAMDRPELVQDPRFRTLVDRNRHAAEIDGIVREWTLRHTVEEIEARLNAAEVPASRIYTIADVFADPHYRARGMLVETPDEDLGKVTLAGPVPQLSRTPGSIRRSGGRIGQDTRAVLSRLGGYTAAELDELEERGVIYSDRVKAAS
jgi:crotonobetainyl-CoA:carnitine CoA-transferase CaiB-like acyl-CoA transferase